MIWSHRIVELRRRSPDYELQAAQSRVRAVTISLLLVALCPAVLSARTWTDREGRQFDGTFVEFKKGNAVIKRQSDDKVFSVALGTLSDLDQQFVVEATVLAELLNVPFGEYVAHATDSTQKEKLARSMVIVLEKDKTSEKLRRAEAVLRGELAGIDADGKMRLAQSKLDLERLRVLGQDIMASQADADRLRRDLVSSQKKLTAMNAPLARAMARVESQVYAAMTASYAAAKVEHRALYNLRLTERLHRAQEEVKLLSVDRDLSPTAHHRFLNQREMNDLKAARSRAEDLLLEAIKSNPDWKGGIVNAHSVILSTMR